MRLAASTCSDYEVTLEKGNVDERSSYRYRRVGRQDSYEQSVRIEKRNESEKCFVHQGSMYVFLFE